MTQLPFQISDEASAYIKDAFSAIDRNPVLAGYVPCLYIATKLESKDSEGRLVAQYLKPHVNVGCDSPERLMRPDYLAFEIAGRKVIVMSDTLSRLRGKNLVVEPVPAGFPKPESKILRLMFAR
jgi:hypothetical protein